MGTLAVNHPQAAISVEQMKRLLDAAATLLDVAPPALPAVRELVEVRGQVLAMVSIAHGQVMTIADCARRVATTVCTGAGATCAAAAALCDEQGAGAGQPRLLVQRVSTPPHTLKL